MAVKYPTEVLNEAREGSTSIGISADWAYDKAIADALELERLKGINLDLPYLYAHNTKPLFDTEDLSSWVENNWHTTSPLAVSADTTNFKTGTQALKLTTQTANIDGAYIADPLVLDAMIDGATSTDDDYIQLAVYVPTNNINTCRLIFPCDAVGTLTNYFQYNINSLFSVGWNYLKLAKSGFSGYGTADWADVKGVVIRLQTNDASAATISIAVPQMVRKDPISAIPNPLQIENDGVMERLFEILQGVVYLGYDNSQLVLKIIENSNIRSTYDAGYVIYQKVQYISSGTNDISILNQVDNNNYYGIQYIGDDIRIVEKITGAYSVIASDDYPVTLGDEITAQNRFINKTLNTDLSKSSASGYLSAIASSQITGISYITMVVYEDCSILSFKASSSPQILGGA